MADICHQPVIKLQLELEFNAAAMWKTKDEKIIVEKKAHEVEVVAREVRAQVVEE